MTPTLVRIQTFYNDEEFLSFLIDVGVVFCRVYLTRQTSAAHQRVLEEVEMIVKFDTGKSLAWRHLHALSIDEHEGMILHWAADQHGGQAKGLCRFSPNASCNSNKETLRPWNAPSTVGAKLTIQGGLA